MTCYLNKLVIALTVTNKQSIGFSGTLENDFMELTNMVSVLDLESSTVLAWGYSVNILNFISLRS